MFDANINNYFDAIEAITSIGGWVIRMGDNSMSKLPKMTRVIDYANSSIKNNRTDIILCSKCKFFIGTSSGLYTVAKAFGRPILQTNYPCLSSMYLTKKDL